MELNIFFIVYRESFEAVLILSIIWSILTQSQIAEKTIYRILSVGTFIGILTSALVAIAIYQFQTQLPENFLDLFNNSLLLISIILITHMCVWMAKHAKSIKAEIKKEINQSLKTANHWGVISLIALSIAREGSETVIFLSGTLIEATRQQMMSYLLVATSAFILSLITLFIFLKGFKFFKPKIFFLISTIFLFLTAGSFLIKLTQSLISSEILPPLKENIWDSAWLIDETSRIGDFLSMTLGYHSSPHLITIIFYFSYLSVASLLYFRAQKT
jgi:high-affinity iron transporter